MIPISLKPVAVQTQRIAPDVELQTRLAEDGTVRHVAVVFSSARSRRDILRAVERAREVLKDAPEPISDVEVAIDEVSAAAITEAKRKRARRRKKLGFVS